MGSETESVESAARSALSTLDADDYDVWIKAGLAVKAEFGVAGYELWASWAGRSLKWSEREGQYTWRGLRPRKIGLSWIWSEARKHGWTGRVPQRRDPFELEKWRRKDPPKPREDPHRERALLAAVTARRMIKDGIDDVHPYLERKGFPDQTWRQHEGRLIVPVRRWPAFRDAAAVTSIQTITESGEKKFLRYGRVDHGVFLFAQPRPGKPILMCEGFATALTIRAALKEISLQYPVAVCFSASGLTRVARRCKRALVVADNDASGAGQRAARETGRPHWIPPEQGDANDLHQSHGIEAVIAGLNPALIDWRRRNR